ncbi:hypothetical protein NGM10_11675 [Halorussus salilacus]|uniref:BGTF surface domain-containing protein n=1 Tax=Halorussus salilacus TaxID=2953750 RepID=UPI00209E4135|nr:BGTF surface domain-containing protein [Halorussus salilacus]USZ67384.1 hypothetical protein NGM10_11675 [Halorussus salilacus]
MTSALSTRLAVTAVCLLVVCASVGPVVTARSNADTSSSARIDGAVAAADFDENVVRVTQGESVNFSVSSDADATLNIGSPEMGFWAQSNVSGSSEVTLDTYETDADDIVRGDIDPDLRTEPLDSPLEPGTYDMNLTVNGKQTALAKLIVEPKGEPGLGNDVDRWILPSGTELDDVEEPSEVDGAVSVASDEELRVAQGRWVAFGVNTSEFSAGFVGSSSNATDLFGAEFTETDPEMNTEENRFNAANLEKVVHVREDGSVYFFVNTAQHGIDANETYRANVSVVGDSPFLDGPEWVQSSFSVVPPKAELVHAGEPIQLNATETLRGETTLPPGETVNVTASYDGVPPFVEPKEATVESNQSFAVEFDFSDVRRGETVEIALPDQQKTYDGVRIWEVRIDHTGEKVELTKDATITGDTKLEPGSEFDMEVAYTGESSSFTKQKTVIVNQDGEFSADFDLDDASEDGNLSISIPEYNKTVPAILTSQETTDTPASTTTSTPSSTTTETSTTTQETTTTDEPTEETDTATESPLTQQTIQENQSVPGFTLVSTLFVLLAAILLGVRRAQQ